MDEAKEVLQKCEAEAHKGKEITEKFKENCTNASMAVMNGIMTDLTKGFLNSQEEV